MAIYRICLGTYTMLKIKYKKVYTHVKLNNVSSNNKLFFNV